MYARTMNSQLAVSTGFDCFIIFPYEKYWKYFLLCENSWLENGKTFQINSEMEIAGKLENEKKYFFKLFCLRIRAEFFAESGCYG